jgi:hypothetical protein
LFYWCYCFYLRILVSRNCFHIGWSSWRLTVTRQVPLVEQILLTLPEHLRSPSFFSRCRGAQSLVFWVVFCGPLFAFVHFLWRLWCLVFFDLRLLVTHFDFFKLYDLKLPFSWNDAVMQVKVTFRPSNITGWTVLLWRTRISNLELYA